MRLHSVTNVSNPRFRHYQLSTRKNYGQRLSDALGQYQRRRCPLRDMPPTISSVPWRAFVFTQQVANSRCSGLLRQTSRSLERHESREHTASARFPHNVASAVSSHSALVNVSGYDRTWPVSAVIFPSSDTTALATTLRVSGIVSCLALMVRNNKTQRKLFRT